MKETVSDRLNLYITRNPNTNQRRLAQALKVHPTVINKWFTGRVEPSPRLLFKTIELFPDIDANWLIRGNTEEKNYTKIENKEENNLLNENSSEVDYLKQIIKEKNEQINLLKLLLDKK